MRKNKEAQKLAKLRWKDKTKEERSEHGRKMVNARWAKRKKLDKAKKK